MNDIPPLALSPSCKKELKSYFKHAQYSLDLGLTYESWLEGHFLAFTAKSSSPTAQSFMRFMHDTYADVVSTAMSAQTLH